MRTCAALLTLLVVAPARADGPPRNGRAMKVAGIVTVAFALALVAGGAALIATGGTCKPMDSYSCGELGGGVEILGGVLMITAGVFATAVGVPLWVVGQRRQARLSFAPSRFALQW